MARQKRPSGKREERRRIEEQAQPGAWDRLSVPARHAICAGFLVLLSIAFFSILHFTGKGLVPSDTVQWKAMAQVMLEAREQTGETPL